MPGLLRKANEGFNTLLRGLTPEDRMGGLLSPQQAQSNQRQAQMALASSLLQGGGPSPSPVGFMSNLGQSLQQAQGVQNQLGQKSIQNSLVPLQRQLLQSQILANRAPQQRAEPEIVRTARILADPDEDPEVKAEIRERLESSNQSEQLGQMLQWLQIQEIQRQRDEASTKAEQEAADARLSTLNSIDALTEAANINERLRGTFGETGLGFDELRRAASGPFAVFARLFGGDEQQARRVAADLGRFEQLTNREAIEQLFSGQAVGGTVSDAKMRQYLLTKPGMSQLPETNAAILADMLQSSLDSATKLKLELPNRTQVEQLIESLRQQEEQESAPEEEQESAPADGIPTPTTQEEYDALPSGAIFIDPDDGKRYRKP